MTRPTPEKAKEMHYRNLVKDIWENNFGRSKDEFTRISLGVQFLEIRIGEEGIDVHRSLFEDYFSASSGEQKKLYISRIENYLKALL
jgi:hypothetical protein